MKGSDGFELAARSLCEDLKLVRVELINRELCSRYYVAKLLCKVLSGKRKGLDGDQFSYGSYD